MCRPARGNCTRNHDECRCISRPADHGVHELVLARPHRHIRRLQLCAADASGRSMKRSVALVAHRGWGSSEHAPGANAHSQMHSIRLPCCFAMEFCRADSMNADLLQDGCRRSSHPDSESRLLSAATASSRLVCRHRVYRRYLFTLFIRHMRRKPAAHGSVHLVHTFVTTLAAHSPWRSSIGELVWGRCRHLCGWRCAGLHHGEGSQPRSEAPGQCQDGCRRQEACCGRLNLRKFNCTVCWTGVWRSNDSAERCCNECSIPHTLSTDNC